MIIRAARCREQRQPLGPALAALESNWRLPGASETQRAALLAFADLLVTWSARINLTGARSTAAVIDEPLPRRLRARRPTPPGRPG